MYQIQYSWACTAGPDQDQVQYGMHARSTYNLPRLPPHDGNVTLLVLQLGAVDRYLRPMPSPPHHVQSVSTPSGPLCDTSPLPRLHDLTMHQLDTDAECARSSLILLVLSHSSLGTCHLAKRITSAADSGAGFSTTARAAGRRPLLCCRAGGRSQCDGLGACLFLR